MYEIVEPRIEALKKEIERILALVNLEAQGQSLQVDGFRLRDLAHWQTGYADNAFEALGPLSGVCNANCVFCMESKLPFERDQSVLSLPEAETRLRYFSAETKRCLFPSARPHMESLLNKQAIPILAQARSINPSEILIITTNGSTLTAEFVEQLTQLQPLLLKLSINSTDLAIRQARMGLRQEVNIAVASMDLLRKAGIPFVGSIVAWPDMERAELEQSIRDISAFNPYGIRIRLPLVHKYMAAIPPANLRSLWQDTSALVEELKGQFAVPIWIEPVQFGRVPILPVVDGVIPNSPAMLAGVQAGDQIVELNGQPISTRLEIRSCFQSGALDQLANVEVKLCRGEELLTLQLSSTQPLQQSPSQAPNDSVATNKVAGLAYPYDSNLHHPGERFGLLLLPDFDPAFLENIVQLIQKNQAGKVLLFCSPLTAGTIEQLIAQIPVFHDFFQDKELWIYTLAETWMEGNTQLLDSRFVADYENALLKFCAEVQDRPELILIPDSFGSAWGIDFQGRSVFEIQTSTGIPVELIPWHYIYGRED